MSWEETLRTVIRKYQRGSEAIVPDWVAAGEAVAERANTNCGDRATLCRSDSGGVWVKVTGCSICHASAAVLNRIAPYVGEQKLQTLAEAVIAEIGAEETAEGDGATRDTEDASRSPDLVGIPASIAEELQAFLALRGVPGRRRCATLPWEVLIGEAPVGK